MKHSPFIEEKHIDKDLDVEEHLVDYKGGKIFYIVTPLKEGIKVTAVYRKYSFLYAWMIEFLENEIDRNNLIESIHKNCMLSDKYSNRGFSSYILMDIDKFDRFSLKILNERLPKIENVLTDLGRKSDI